MPLHTKKTYVVYGLFDPTSKAIRYIGRTGRPVIKRLYAHLSKEQLKRDDHKARWIRSLLYAGRRPHIAVIETYDAEEDSVSGEVEWIALLRKIGHKLTNCSPGGNGSYMGNPPRRAPVTEETKQRISASLKGRVVSEETREKIRCAHIGMKHSEETKALISAKKKGVKSSIDSKRKRSERMKRDYANGTRVPATCDWTTEKRMRVSAGVTRWWADRKKAKDGT